MALAAGIRPSKGTLPGTPGFHLHGDEEGKI